MSFCLNPACSRPENPDSNRFCQGCGAELAQNRISYDFRVHYRVIQLLGEGAFGRTYLAKDVDFMEELRVIKKFIAQGQGKNLQKAKDLFKQEAQRLYELNHPQIPKLYAHFEQENSLYLVQEFIEGKDLWQEFLKQREFDEQKVVNLLQDLLPVLQYLHTNHILHRDIKPENIMRRSTSSPKGGQLVLIDFGGAKQITETVQVRTGTRLYTPGYAAMEHISGKPKPASDIYSLGVTCIRLMTGCFPQEDSYGNLQDEIYDADNGRWLWREHLSQGVRISSQLGQVLDRMLEPFARDRYQSAREVLAALNNTPQQPTPTVTRQTVPQPPNPQPIPTEISAQSKSPQPTPRPTPVVSGGNSLTRKRFLKLAGWGSVGVAAVGGIGWVLSRRDSPLLNLSETPAGYTLSPFSFDVITVNARGEEINRETKQAQYFTVDLGNGVTMDMVAIPGGRFLMGSPETEEGRQDNEGPQHWVDVPPFFMGKYEVTQAQYEAVMDTNPARFKGDNRPVERFSWNDATEFCQQLSQKTGLDFRLPSEAEWEYACRSVISEQLSVTSKGLTNSQWNERYGRPFHFGKTITTDLANYRGTDWKIADTTYPGSYADAPKGEYRQETTPVGTFPPNAFGLYDMHGNVYEWCEDTWHENYMGAPTDGSAWLEGGDSNLRLLRGGSWLIFPRFCRSAVRVRHDAGSGDYVVGLRVAA